MEEEIPAGLLGKKGELLVTNRLLRNYEVFFPYFDRGVDLIVKRKDEKKFFTIQCRTRDFRKNTRRYLVIRKNDFEKMKANIDFLVFVLYLNEDKIRFIIFPINWLEKVIEKMNQRTLIEKNYNLTIKHEDNIITYEPPKGLNISEKELDISRFIDDKGWAQLR